MTSDLRTGTYLSLAIGIAITLLDGFDAMTLSLAAPHLAAALALNTAQLGVLFSSQMAGMMVGAALGGYVADRFGRLGALLSFMALFSLAAFTVPLIDSFDLLLLNRPVAGVGLGAVAPIVVALVSGRFPAARSAFVISCIWAGLPAGGILAALFNYLAVPALGWESIFVVGGILPLVLAWPAWHAFRGTGAAQEAAGIQRAAPGALRQAFRTIGWRRLAGLGVLFLFGYSAMTIVIYWLPTILTLRGGAGLLVLLAFAGVNLGSAAGSALAGLCADRFGMKVVMPLAWLVAGTCLMALVWPGLGGIPFLAIAIVGATCTAGGIALLVVSASQLEPAYTSTMIGAMVTTGRLGQVGALAVSGLLAQRLHQPASVFLIAGGAALLTALLSLARFGNADLPDNNASVPTDRI